MRQWIVPRPAVVRESRNELFILDAPLEVKMETEYFKSGGITADAGQATSDTQRDEAAYRQRILPELEKAVNTAPEYADLRRVYGSRVAAEWYRQRSAKKPTAYGHLIDSGDVSAWPSRVKWDPKEVFNRFVKSFTDGEFKVERTSRRGDMVVTHLYVYGGVDFTNIPKKLLSGGEFTSNRPALDVTVGGALSAPTAEERKDKTWRPTDRWSGVRSLDRRVRRFRWMTADLRGLAAVPDRHDRGEAERRWQPTRQSPAVHPPAAGRSRPHRGGPNRKLATAAPVPVGSVAG
jgi:hypothetical protein